MNIQDHINELIKTLSDTEPGQPEDTIFVGFDGYIDKIQKAVKTRSANEVTYYPTLTEFASRIDMAAGKSGQVELVTQELKIGGNAPIMSNSLGHLGIRSKCLGNSGYPVENPQYKQLHSNVEMLSIGDPAETNALEFNDGKMILSELSTFRKITWNYVKGILGLETIRKNLKECSILALVGWCNPDHATDVWKGILEEGLEKDDRKKLMFFDLADPTKKSTQDLMDVLDVINRFTEFGTVILGINENETLKLYDILSEDKDRSLHEYDLADYGKFIFSKLKIDGLLIHPVERSILITQNGIINIEAPVVKEPKISTGGGDNLNAGFCTGYALGLPVEQSMILGMATSGSYVKNGKSPDFPEIITYLKTW